MAWEAEIAVVAARYALNTPLLTAQVQHESNFNPLAIGDGGLALGLLQIHPAAAQEMGKDWNAIKAAINAGDAETAATLSLDAGAAYLAKMLKLFNGDQKWAMAAYNQGETVISRAYSYANAVLALVND